MKPQPRLSYGLSLITLMGMALAGSLMIWIATGPWGIGTNTDSANYIGGARNILAGHGYSNFTSRSPITHWPPFFSFSLAAIGLFGIDPLDGARYLHSVLFGVNILMVGLILKKLTGSVWAALAGAFFMITSKSMLMIHAWVCSEPWFIFLTFTSIYFLTIFLTGPRYKFLILSAALAALACVDRYAGVSLIAAGGLCILLFDPKTFWLRIRDAFVFFLIAFTPLGMWMVRNHLLANDAVGRKFYVHALSPKYFLDALDTVSRWILPADVPPSMRYSAVIALGIFVIVLLALTLRTYAINRPSKTLGSSDFFIFTFAATIFSLGILSLHLFLHLFVNASVRADDRHFSAIFVAGLMTTIIIIHRSLRLYPGRPALKIVTALLFIALSVSTSLIVTKVISRIYNKGYGVTDRLWRNSETIKKLNSFPPKTLMYSNNSASIYLITGHPARRLPRKYSNRRYRDQDSAKPSPRFTSRVEKIKDKLIKKDGYIVFFHRGNKWHKLTKADIERLFPLIPVYKLRDGTVYKIDPSKEPTII